MSLRAEDKNATQEAETRSRSLHMQGLQERRVAWEHLVICPQAAVPHSARPL
jgi:hypothetical protein